MHVLGRSDQDGVGRDGVFEKAFVVGEALFGLQSEFGGDCVAADVVELRYADQFHPVGIPDRVFEVFVGTVARPDGYDRTGFVSLVRSICLLLFRRFRHFRRLFLFGGVLALGPLREFDAQFIQPV